VSALRFVYLGALALWLGGLAGLGAIAAPVVFDVLGGAMGPGGRVLAGATFGAMLARFHPVSIACGAVMGVALVGMALLGPRPRPFGARLALLAAMVVATLAVAGPIATRVEAVQREVPGSIRALPTTDARRARFERLHGLANVLLGANALAGCLLLYWESRH
jgi:hypothetical protein